MAKTDKTDIRSLTRDQLRQTLVDLNERPFRGDQIYQWLWAKSVKDFDQMTNLSEALRNKLKDQFTIPFIEMSQWQKSNDLTIKYAVSLHDKNIVECVLIPTDTRITACISSQVGCSLDCTFCATASLKRMRNLNPYEIYDQVVLIRDQSQKQYQRPLTNIVFMGMGEPLLNYNHVMEAIDKITNQQGLGISAKRITVSTSGVPKMIKRLAEEKSKIHLAVSLHSAIEETRNHIMPFSINFPLIDLKRSLTYWYQKTKRKITFEYIVWQGINDREKDIEALVNFCKSIPSKVNIIEYNPIQAIQYRQAEQSCIKAYIDQLKASKIAVSIRYSRGKDIDAACGQLANRNIS